jgi:hypothetical protein
MGAGAFIIGGILNNIGLVVASIALMLCVFLGAVAIFLARKGKV